MTLRIFLIMTFTFAALDAGTLKGHVKYDGKAPKPKRLRMDADPVCGSSHSGPVKSENFKMAKDGSMEDVLVYLKNVKYSGGIPSEPAVLDQQGCIYVPHVFGMMAGQELLIKNSDATLHNIHSMAKTNTQFNFAMPKVVKEKTVSFDKVEDPFYIKCDVHPWMKAWVAVFDHPYFAVTDKDGNFKIDGIPAGTYEVIAWQEKFKMKKHLTATVTIGEGETVNNFTFVRQSKKKK